MLDMNPEIARRLGYEILPFQMGYLPEFFQKKAEVELHDSPENRQRGIKVLKDMMEKDKLFNGISFDDDFLLQYLRCKKFDVKKAFSRLKAYVNLRKRYRSIFTGFIYENIAITDKVKFVTFLPYRCQDGCVIILVELDNWIPEEFLPEDVRRTAVLFLLQSLRDPMTQVNGFKVIFDVKSNPLRHIKYATPYNMYLMYYGTQECSPGRFKEFHFVNKGISFYAGWTILKTFLSAKIRKRVHIHDKPESLLNFFPAAVLPEKYGGQLKDYNMTNWMQDVMSPEKLATFGGGNQNEY